MNNDLISRSALRAEAIEMEIFQPYGGDGSCMGVTVGTIDCAPAVDAELVRHGRWVQTYPDRCHFHCSTCKRGAYYSGVVLTDFCPNCGAKMDGDVNVTG